MSTEACTATGFGVYIGTLQGDCVSGSGPLVAALGDVDVPGVNFGDNIGTACSLVRGLRFKNSSAGVTPVTE